MCELADLDDVAARYKLRSNCGKTKVFRRNGTNYRNQSDMEGSYQGVQKCVSWPISMMWRREISFVVSK